MQNKELTVQTPLGELAVGINADPDYPGISVAFRGDGMNDKPTHTAFYSTSASFNTRREVR